MISPGLDGPTGRFRPLFNPATVEHIEFTAVAEDTDGKVVRFHWRSEPGGVVTEHVHPNRRSASPSPPARAASP